MPQIPRASDIARVVPSGQQRISSVGGQTAITNAAANRGRLLVGVAQDFAQDAAVKRSDAKQKKDRYELMQAKSNFYKGKVALDNSFDDDQDYGTVPQRYSEGASDLATAAAEAITDPALRNEFLMDTEMQAAAGFQRIQQVAKATEVDAQRGFMSNQIADVREAGLQGDIREAMDHTAEIIEAGVQSGYYTVEEGAGLLRKAQTDLAVARLETMEPEDRLEALSSPWAEKIPSDIRTNMLRVAKKETDKNTAILIVDDLKAQDLDPTAAREVLSSIEDLDVRVEAEQRYNVERQMDRNAQVEVQEELYNKYYDGVRRDGKLVKDIPPEDLDAMSPGVQNSLYAAERAAVERKSTGSDRAVVDRLYQLYNDGHGSPQETRVFFQENAHLLSNSDYDQWSKTTSSDFENLENDPIFTGKEQIANAMIEVYGYEDTEERNERQSGFERKYEKYMFEYRAQNEGKDPDGNAQREYIERLTLSLPTKEAFFGKAGKDFENFDSMTPEKKGETLEFLRSSDPESYQRAIDIGGPDATPDDMAYLFSILSDFDDAP